MLDDDISDKTLKLIKKYCEEHNKHKERDEALESDELIALRKR